MRLFLGCIQWRRLHQGLQREGKVRPLKKLEMCHKVFMQFGDEWDLKSHVLEQLEEFTCLVDGQNRESSMDGLRAKSLRKIVRENEKLISKPKVYLSRLPPCHPALKPHFQQVNHRIALYKRADESSWKKQIPTMMVKGG